MNSDMNPSPLRDVAQNPQAFARWLADIQRVVLDIGVKLEELQRETRVHCRGVHVQGDRWYEARMRALPVERALKDVLKNINGLAQGLEKSAHKRLAYEDNVNELPGKRKAKALAKEQKKNPGVLRSAPESTGQASAASNERRGGPASIYDLGKERSA